MDVAAHNRIAWDALVEMGDRWTVPVSNEEVQKARQGEFDLLLTPTKPVPMTWFPPLRGTTTLCLASGGGQQGPLLAAAGAAVTVFDASPKQLDQDRRVAQRDGLRIRTVQGDMADLSAFATASFALVVHPCSNCFVPDVQPVWRESFRVLRPGGLLLSGFINPSRYIFDEPNRGGENLQVRHALPYCDLNGLSESEFKRLIDRQQPIEFSHTLEDLIGGQLDAGFLIDGFYEDRYEEEEDPLSRYLSTFIATRALKPALG